MVSHSSQPPSGADVGKSRREILQVAAKASLLAALASSTAQSSLADTPDPKITQPSPPSDHTFIYSDIYSDATKLAELIRTRAVSPVEVVQAHLDRIEAINPKLNAIVTVAAGALEAAKKAEAAVLAGEELEHSRPPVWACSQG